MRMTISDIFSALFKMIVQFTVEFTCVNKCHLNHII